LLGGLLLLGLGGSGLDHVRSKPFDKGGLPGVLLFLGDFIPGLDEVFRLNREGCGHTPHGFVRIDYLEGGRT
jgi:hypothetical protein